MRDPRFLGSDAAYKAITAQLVYYETEIVRAFDDFAILPRFFGSQNLNRPGLKTYHWKQLEKGQSAAVSMDGDEQITGDVGYEVATTNFFSVNQRYNLKRAELAYAGESGIPLEVDTARAVGQNIAETLDYTLWNGNAATASGPTLTAIKSVSGVQDAGAPSGVWDVAGVAYADILEQIGLLRNVGWTGPVDVLYTPGIRALMDRFVSDGVTTFPITYGTWLQNLINGGQQFVSSHFVQPWSMDGGTDTGTVPSKVDKLTGAGGTAVNWLVMNARGQSFQVKYAHDLKTLDIPVQEGDVAKNVVVKATYKYARPNHLVWRDAIDMVT